jgi:hypothetical protein
MPVKPSNKGLGITKNEGGPKLRKAIGTLGYKKSEKVVQRTKARVTAPKVGGSLKPGVRAKSPRNRPGVPKAPGLLGFKPGR